MEIKVVRHFSLLIILFCHPLFAGSGGGHVTQTLVHEGNILIFSTEIHTNKPPCSTQGNSWAISLETETGRSMYKTVLLAATLKQPILIHGAHDCQSWGDRERPRWIAINH